MSMGEIGEDFACHTGIWAIGESLEEFANGGQKGKIIQLSHWTLNMATK